MPTNRFSLILALAVVAALAVFTISMATASPSNIASDPNSDLIQRRGEWTAGASAEQAYQDQRHEEQTTGQAVSSFPAYLEQRHGEQTTGQIMDSTLAYLEQRHGEQTTGVNPALAHLDYRRGEWSGK